MGMNGLLPRTDTDADMELCGAFRSEAPWPPAGATCGTCIYAREMAMADGSRILACDIDDELAQVFEGSGRDCEWWDGVTAA